LLNVYLLMYFRNKTKRYQTIEYFDCFLSIVLVINKSVSSNSCSGLAFYSALLVDVDRCRSFVLRLSVIRGDYFLPFWKRIRVVERRLIMFRLTRKICVSTLPIVGKRYANYASKPIVNPPIKYTEVRVTNTRT